MRTSDRVAWLEALGYVPEDADDVDWELAAKTSWWGRRLDPIAFWSGHLIWQDSNSIQRAHQRGRGYPPIPKYFSTQLKAISDDDMRVGIDSLDGPRNRFRISDRERCFWDWYSKTHPQPPEALDEKQREIAKSIFSDSYPRADSGELQLQIRLARDLGFPSELWETVGLKAAYIASMRSRVELLKSRFQRDSIPADRAISSSGIDPAVLEGGPSEMESERGDEWKYRYLQRLSKEGVDVGFIDYYKQYWKLRDAK